MTCPVDIRPRLTLVPKIVATIAAIWPRMPPPPPPPAGRPAAAGTGLIGGRRSTCDALQDHLVGRLRVYGGVVFALHRARIHDGLALLRRDRPDPRRRRPDHDAFDHGRRAAAFEERHQRLALA